MHTPDIPVHYHAEDRLPANALALSDEVGGHVVDIYLSRAHPLDLVLSALEMLLASPAVEQPALASV